MTVLTQHNLLAYIPVGTELAFTLYEENPAIFSELAIDALADIKEARNA